MDFISINGEINETILSPMKQNVVTHAPLEGQLLLNYADMYVETPQSR